VAPGVDPADGDGAPGSRLAGGSTDEGGDAAGGVCGLEPGEVDPDAD